MTIGEERDVDWLVNRDLHQKTASAPQINSAAVKLFPSFMNKIPIYPIMGKVYESYPERSIPILSILQCLGPGGAHFHISCLTLKQNIWGCVRDPQDSKKNNNRDVNSSPPFKTSLQPLLNFDIQSMKATKMSGDNILLWQSPTPPINSFN